MNLPEQPATFRQPTPSERPWWWQLHDAAGTDALAPEEYSTSGSRPFPGGRRSRGWARSGPSWPAAGVASVTLFEHDRAVYGPMSLSA